MAKNKFPVFATIVLIFSIAWLLKELNVYNIKLPILPVILVVFSIGWIFNRFSK
ncbi:MAG TPA: hypothetical protein VJ895_02710 [Candidatus Nanoarchaeia archaeon]|nr:hypothetical protein [Candidatus Nanoarchaeia archaeon]